MVEHDGGLYVFVRVTRFATIRILAVERIRNREIGEDSFEYPADFDADALLASSFQLTFDDPIAVRVWLSPSQARYVEERQWAAGTGKRVAPTVPAASPRAGRHSLSGHSTVRPGGVDSARVRDRRPKRPRSRPVVSATTDSLAAGSAAASRGAMAATRGAHAEADDQVVAQIGVMRKTCFDTGRKPGTGHPDGTSRRRGWSRRGPGAVTGAPGLFSCRMLTVSRGWSSRKAHHPGW